MLIDLSGVARSLREDTFAAAIIRLRDQIAEQLRTTGTFTFQEGERAFTITVRKPTSGHEQPPR